MSICNAGNGIMLLFEQQKNVVVALGVVAGSNKHF